MSVKGWLALRLQKKGPNGNFGVDVFKAVKGAYVTFRKLEQAHNRKQSKLLKTVVPKGITLDKRHLACRLVRETAEHFEAGKQKFMEHRRRSHLGIYFFLVFESF